MDTAEYPSIKLKERDVNNFLKGISKGQAKFLEAKFLEYARVLHNGLVANSRTQVVSRRPIENGERNRGASGLKSGTYRNKK